VSALALGQSPSVSEHRASVIPVTAARARVIAGAAVGDTFIASRTLDAAAVRAFAALSGDHNPVHDAEEFAAAKGFHGLIVHGLLVGSLVTEIGGELAWLASALSFRFLRPVYLGDTVTCRLTLRELDAEGRATAEAILSNRTGETVAEATLRGRLPSPAERELLARLT
jgi:acyl dehydratase